MCFPENGKESLRCSCTIHPDYFVSGLTYILALQFNGTDVWHYSVTPALVGKRLFTLSPGHLVPGFAILADASLLSLERFFLLRGEKCHAGLNAESIWLRNLILE